MILFFKIIRKGRQNNFTKKISTIKSKKNLRKFSAVLIVTDHDQYNYKYIAKNSKNYF